MNKLTKAAAHAIQRTRTFPGRRQRAKSSTEPQSRHFTDRTAAQTLYDIASQISLAGAALYFWGLANIGGDSVALNLPRTLLQKDPWDTVAYGLEGATSSTVLLPFSEADYLIAIPVVLRLLMGILIGTLLIHFLFRKSSHRKLFWALWGAVVFSFWISLHSLLSMQVTIDHYTECEKPKPNRCKGLRVLTQVVYEGADGRPVVVHGLVLYAGAKNMVLHTGSGQLLLPVPSIKQIRNLRKEDLDQEEDAEPPRPRASEANSAPLARPG